MKLIVALLVFGIIVMFHEFGHFIVAKKNGIVVEEFSIGMGPKLVGFKRGDTEYSIRILPIGGACMMLGEDTAEEHLEGSFNSKTVWQRMAVVFAGPFFNFIMAFICAVFIVGSNGYVSSEIVSVSENSPAMEAGLKEGDLIIKADKTNIHSFTDFRLYVSLDEGKEIEITYERDGEKYTTMVTPRLEEDGAYRIGIIGGVLEKPSIPGTLVQGFYEVKSNINLVIKSLEMLIKGKVSTNEITGPVGMFDIIGSSYEEATQYGLMTVLLTLADLILLLSANLGVMNLLPLPALDGGRLVFMIVEAVRGKPVSRDKEGYVHFIGFILLLVLMAFVMFNDLVRMFG